MDPRLERTATRRLHPCPRSRCELNPPGPGEPGTLDLRCPSRHTPSAGTAAERTRLLIPLFTTVAGFGLLSNFLGYLRETALAASYGSTAVTDALFGAAFIPNTLYTIIASGAGAAILVPVLVEYRARGDAEARELALTVLHLTMLLLVVLTLGLTLTSSFWIRLLFPGFSPETESLAVRLAYVLNPTVLFLSLAAILAGILNSFGHFRTVAVAPCVGNIVTILAICVSTSLGGIRGAALGMVGGALVQVAVMSWMAFSKAVPYRIRFRGTHPGLRLFAGMAAPTTVYLAVAYVSLTAERVFASAFPSGAVSTLSYAMRLFTLPASIVAGSVATVLHTEFSFLARRGENDRLSESFRRGLDLTILALVPISIGALVFSHSIVAVAYGYGKFSGENVGTTAATFAAYSLGILPLALTVLCQRLFYAMRAPRVPLIIECVALVVYLITAPLLGRAFHLPGLALARTGSFLLVAGLSLAVAFRKLVHGDKSISMMSQLARCAISAIPTAVFWLVLAAQFHLVEPTTAVWLRLSVLVVGGALGVGLYLLTARAFRCREADNVIQEAVRRVAGAGWLMRRADAS